MILRGRDFSENEIDLIKKIISEKQCLSRRKLSLRICDLLDWKQPNGALKDRACRDVLLRLQKKGLIQLPQSRYELNSQKVSIKSLEFQRPKNDLVGKINDFPPESLQFKLVEKLSELHLWNYLIQKYHYRGCNTTVGRHIKYFIYLADNLIGCIAFADAVLKLKHRDY